MSEMAVSGKWVRAGRDGFDASMHGSPIEEDEAANYSGDDWPKTDK